jgi:hypothetical protein
MLLCGAVLCASRKVGECLALLHAAGGRKRSEVNSARMKEWKKKRRTKKSKHSRLHVELPLRAA